MKCPGCTKELIKEPKTGECVKTCLNCGSRWFILRTSKELI